MAGGKAEINQCPPGGDISITELSRLLSREAKPLNPNNGSHQPLRLAFIQEQSCIGCKLCIAACPLDCIVGAPKLMHTVIANECSGCELCQPACPTDCIIMVPAPAEHGKSGAPSKWHEFSQPQVEKARYRAQQKRARLAKLEQMRAEQRTKRLRGTLKKEILAAVQRNQAKQQKQSQINPA